MWTLAIVVASHITPKYTLTPYGPMLSHCVREVPSGAHLTELEDGSTLVVQDGLEAFVLPRCNTRNGSWPLLRQSYPSSSSLPPNYDGWLEYTALNVSALGLSGGFDAFTSTMSVPDTPKEMPQQLFLFPGLQNYDWIPKVDPLPTSSTPFDIIQPVLQYPGPLSSWNKWALKSWYVTINAGALYSEAISGIEPGDTVLCNMTRTGDQTWRISGALASNPGKATVQEANNARLKLQPWAYSAVAECYGCKGCSTYPTIPVKFGNNRLFQSGKELHVPAHLWQSNPKPALRRMCNESVLVGENGDATISWL